jgi:hypothetical protein
VLMRRPGAEPDDSEFLSKAIERRDGSRQRLIALYLRRIKGLRHDSPFDGTVKAAVTLKLSRDGIVNIAGQYSINVRIQR